MLRLACFRVALPTRLPTHQLYFPDAMRNLPRRLNRRDERIYRNFSYLCTYPDVIMRFYQILFRVVVAM